MSYIRSLVGLIISLSTLTHSSLHPLLSDDLVHNALSVLEKAHEVKYQFIKEVFVAASARKEIVNPITMLDAIKKFEATCPYFLLDECSEAQHCYLSRGFDTTFRDTFENTISSSLITALRNSPSQSAHYLVFASGYLFTDLVILAKTLIEQPNAQLTIHLIDTEYQPSLAPSSTTDQFDEAVITYYVPIMQAIFRQFSTCLATMFPNATITIRLYGEHEVFLKQLANKQIPYPDVVSAADLPSSHRILHEYMTLVKTILTHKSDMKNFFLNASNCLPFNSNKENGKIGAYAVIKSHTIDQNGTLGTVQTVIPSSNKLTPHDNNENSAIINFIVRKYH